MFLQFEAYLCDMMRRVNSIITVLFLSALIVYGGSGINTYFYCCGHCQASGPKTVTHHCCKTEHSTDTPFVTDFSNYLCHPPHPSANTPDKKCGVERLSFDWQSFSGSPIHLQPTILDLDNLFGLVARIIPSVSEQPTVADGSYRNSQKPPDLTQKDYFTLLTILVI